MILMREIACYQLVIASAGRMPSVFDSHKVVEVVDHCITEDMFDHFSS